MSEIAVKLSGKCTKISNLQLPKVSAPRVVIMGDNLTKAKQEQSTKS